jgi:hypothetical protein
LMKVIILTLENYTISQIHKQFHETN